jgi:hypothetical protein
MHFSEVLCASVVGKYVLVKCFVRVF